MSSCCRSNACETVSRPPEACPSSGSKGVPVELETVKALLTEAALARLEPASYRLCLDPACDVVYFAGAGHTFARADVRVPVWQKEPAGARTVCYCFGENEADIRAEIARGGGSHAVARVTDHIRAGRCACDVRNPKGTCCLGDLAAAVTRMAAAVEPGTGV